MQKANSRKQIAAAREIGNSSCRDWSKWDYALMCTRYEAPPATCQNQSYTKSRLFSCCGTENVTRCQNMDLSSRSSMYSFGYHSDYATPAATEIAARGEPWNEERRESLAFEYLYKLRDQNTYTFREHSLE